MPDPRRVNPKTTYGSHGFCCIASIPPQRPPGLVGERLPCGRPRFCRWPRQICSPLFVRNFIGCWVGDGNEATLRTCRGENEEYPVRHLLDMNTEIFVG